MNLVYVQIRSWHVVGDPGRTLCGRATNTNQPKSDTLPTGRSCEACYRVLSRRIDHPVG